MIELLIFGLAFLAYVLLGINVVLHTAPLAWRPLTTAVAIAAGIHVALVWSFRFEWSITQALDKGWPGFVIFHSALATILAAALAREPWSGRLTYLAFPIVTAGSLGAAFKYDYVAGYRWPLLIVFLAVIGL